LSARNGKAVVFRKTCRLRNLQLRLTENKSITFAPEQGGRFYSCMDCWVDRSAGAGICKRSPRGTLFLPSIYQAMVDCSMPAQAARISSLLERLKLEEVDVVGCSWGGAIAMFLAAQSAKVRSLVLTAPVNPWSNFGTRRIRFLRRFIGEALLRAVWPVSRPLYRTALARMYGDPERLPSGTVEGYASMVMRPGRVNNILNTLKSWEKDVNALHAAIPRIRARSLLIWGTLDGAVDVRSAENLKQALPHCRLALIEGAGHLPFEETPDEFNRLVLDFVDQHERPEAGA
jgi:pimeloyl-ACP methyl ester carboxylesterase